jgi:hypothetical protein
MAKAEIPVPDKAEFKKMFAKSMKKPMNCAVAKGPSNTVVMLMHKSKKLGALKPLVEAKFGKDNVSDIRWGTVSIDKAEDSKLAVLNMNKNLAGCAPKLKKWLKGCGVSKIRYMVEGKVTEEVLTLDPGEENEPDLVEDDEDDENETETGNDNETVSEDTANENEAAETEQPAAPEPAMQAAPETESAETQSNETQAAEAPPAAPPPPAVDTNALTKRLTDLVKRMIQVVQNDPGRQNELKGLAVAAQAALKGGDPQAAEAAIDAFEQALGGGSSNNNANAANADSAQAPPAAPPPPPMDPAKKAALEASPKIWNDTISVVTTGVSALKDAIRKDFADEAPEVVADIEKNLSRIDQVTARFDKQLADLLEGVNAATDEAARKAGLAKARSVLADHIKYAASEPLIGMIDQNPFGVSPDIKKTLVANLTQLANAIR